MSISSSVQLLLWGFGKNRSPDTIQAWSCSCTCHTLELPCLTGLMYIKWRRELPCFPCTSVPLNFFMRAETVGNKGNSAEEVLNLGGFAALHLWGHCHRVSSGVLDLGSWRRSKAKPNTVKLVYRWSGFTIIQLCLPWNFIQIKRCLWREFFNRATDLSQHLPRSFVPRCWQPPPYHVIKSLAVTSPAVLLTLSSSHVGLKWH